MVGDIPNLGTVWFNPSLIANILSLAQVWQACHVTMDLSDRPALIVHRKDGLLMLFIEHDNGL